MSNIQTFVWKYNISNLIYSTVKTNNIFWEFYEIIKNEMQINENKTKFAATKKNL